MRRQVGRRAHPGAGRRLLVVSHPGVLAVNQEVYRAMRADGWEVTVVIPDRWRHEYRSGTFPAERLEGMEDVVRPLRVALAGRAQRHFYLARPSRVIRSSRADVLFLEQEPFAVPSLQWGLAAHRAGIPFGVQADENLDRRMQLPARAIRRWVLRHTAFVAARSPTAARLVRAWGTHAPATLVPHAVPEWTAPGRPPSGSFTVGFAGRLVPEKGLWDLVTAVRSLDRPVRLLLVGDGPLRAALEAADVGAGVMEVRTGVRHEHMAAAYAEMDVLVLPSRTTAAWAEQFGRVLVEALWCGVPVIGSDSGEIGWVVGETGGGLLFPEGDVPALTERIARFLDDPGLGPRLAAAGRAAVARTFAAPACATALGGIVDAVLAG